jgi:hypothetical protein
MIRWLWDKMLKWGWDYNRGLREEDVHVPFDPKRRRGRRGEDIVMISDNEIELTDPISFRVQAVQGGTLVETRWYDPKTDNSERKLHIVDSSNDLADAISKIVTMELLKR